MAKQDKVPTGKKAKKMGYTSFSQDEFDLSDTSNVIATEYFLQMLQVPQKVRRKVSKGKAHKIKAHDYYPTTLEETELMNNLLYKAYSTVTDTSDENLMNALNEMSEIIEWSKVRQWNYNWGLIAGVILLICILWISTGSEKKNVDQYKAGLELVKKGDEATINKYKRTQIHSDSINIVNDTKTLNNLKSSLDTITDKSKRKLYITDINKYEKNIEIREAKIVKYKGANDKELQKMAENYYRKFLKQAKGSHRKMLVWTILSILLIPLYVIAERPYGYMISKYRTESKILEWIRKILFWLAGSMVGLAAVLPVTETVTTWSDGSKTTDSDSNAAVFFKLVLLMFAVMLFIFTSVAIMLYATITGLIRNYNLIPNLNKSEDAEQLLESVNTFSEEKKRLDSIVGTFPDSMPSPVPAIEQRYTPGHCVWARLRNDGQMFFALILETTDTTVRVRYYDNKEKEISKDDILYLFEILETGMTPYGKWDGNGLFYQCDILEMNKFTLKVKYTSDNVEEELPYMRLEFIEQKKK
ncbi:hypothetical protein LJC30_04625 [Odoribacter sp. OttesenSCG-928-L07]|nr:hypothetical protein [Odoribacter sp. OttesenSCG-928-L07]MDL2239089.1 hypothetical protein [Bacteroidales bacterium OttesenSCG-928-L14]MDL2240002.1 hypothetical protein [Bacteroidales bacterium OttesenSCG-928-K22]